jgi:hypothetical protein
MEHVDESPDTNNMEQSLQRQGKYQGLVGMHENRSQEPTWDSKNVEYNDSQVPVELMRLSGQKDNIIMEERIVPTSRATNRSSHHRSAGRGFFPLHLLGF